MNQAIDRIEYWTRHCKDLPLDILESKCIDAERDIMKGEKVADGYYFALVELIKRKSSLKE